MICSVVLRPTDPLDNASTEVSNLTLPQNSPALFVRRDPSIRFLDYDCEIIPYFSRNVSKEKKLRTEKKKKKSFDEFSTLLLLKATNKFLNLVEELRSFSEREGIVSSNREGR